MSSRSPSRTPPLQPPAVLPPNETAAGFPRRIKIADVKVTIEDATVTATGGAADTGSYGIRAETTSTDKSADVTINGHSVVRLNTTGDHAETIHGTTVNRNSGIVFENGVGTVYGKVTLQEDLTVDAGESLTIPQGAALTIPDGTTLTNDGTINNQGTLTIRPGGGLAGSGTVTGNSVEWPYTPPPANPNYRIDVTATEGGTVTKDPAAAKAGETVTLTPAPEEGYEVGDVTVTDRFGDTVEVTENADGTYTFTMPNGQVSVNVTFVEMEGGTPALHGCQRGRLVPRRGALRLRQRPHGRRGGRPVRPQRHHQPGHGGDHSAPFGGRAGGGR